jgi:hypothetical protein
MRYRLRTLLIVLAIGPPIAGLMLPLAWSDFCRHMERSHTTVIKAGESEWVIMRRSAGGYQIEFCKRPKALGR